MSCLRLAFVTEHFRACGAGAENDIVNLCGALAQRGHDVHVIADTADASPIIHVHPGLDRIGEHLQTIHADLVIDWGLFQRADIYRIGGGIHQSFTEYNLLAYPAWLRPLKRMRNTLSSRHRRTVARESELLRNSDACFLAISEFVAHQAVAAGAPKAQVRVMYNPVDTARFHPAPDAAARAALRRKWHFPEESTVFLFVAHNLRLKNLRLMQSVFDRIFPVHPQARLAVAGKRRPGFDAPYLVYTGATASMEELYQAADVLVHPTFFDAFGNVVLEAMSCMLPAVVSEYAGVHELITQGKDGFVLSVAGRDAVDVWTRQLLPFLTDPDAGRVVGRAARQTAQKHDFADYVSRLETILLEKTQSKAEGRE